MTERILVIDREQGILKTLDTLLTQEGYQISSVLGGDEVIGVIKSESFDLVIMDIRMLGTDGLELMRHIKELDDEIEVIILTGSATIDNAVRALRDDGAFDFLAKPLKNVDQLIISIKQALHKQRLHREKKALLKGLEQSNEDLKSRVQELTAELAKIKEQLPAKVNELKQGEKS
jgi:DNA-binding NtrC family response regulator